MVINGPFLSFDSYSYTGTHTHKYIHYDHHYHSSSFVALWIFLCLYHWNIIMEMMIIITFNFHVKNITLMGKQQQYIINTYAEHNRMCAIGEKERRQWQNHTTFGIFLFHTNTYNISSEYYIYYKIQYGWIRFVKLNYAATLADQTHLILHAPCKSFYNNKYEIGFWCYA